MSEPSIVSVGEEAVERQRELDAAALREFVTQWDMESMPACPVGMALLYELSTAHPSAYEMARQKGFQETPRLNNNQRWLAFTAHRNTCLDCNESGVLSHRFEGRYPPDYQPPDPLRKPL